MGFASASLLARRLAIGVAAVVLTVAASAPSALADGGLPELASVQAGPFTAGLYNNAPTLVTGSNTLTVQIPALPDHHAVTLSLDGPHGQQLDVSLRPVQTLDGPPDMHAGHDMQGMSVMPSVETSTYLARGTVVVPEAGAWQARLVVRKAGGESFVGHAPLAAEVGGPNPVYLMVAGGLITGFLVYGVWQRHRRQAGSTR
jgi:hypothetical protein